MSNKSIESCKVFIEKGMGSNRQPNGRTCGYCGHQDGDIVERIGHWDLHPQSPLGNFVVVLVERHRGINLHFEETPDFSFCCELCIGEIEFQGSRRQRFYFPEKTLEMIADRKKERETLRIKEEEERISEQARFRQALRDAEADAFVTKMTKPPHSTARASTFKALKQAARR